MRYSVIRSFSNPKIKEAVEIKRRRSRYRHEAFLIEGPHLLEMALASGQKIKRVFFSSEFIFHRQGAAIVERLTESPCEICEVSAEVLFKIADTEAPQGVAAIASYSPMLLDALRFDRRKRPLLAVADGITDPGNLGAVIRSSDAFGADALIVLPGTCDPFMPKAVRATAGSLFNIPLVFADRKGLTQWTKKKRIRIAITSADAKMTVFQADLTVPVALVFGSEARGVSTEMREASDLALSIPIAGGAESLNVASSAAIFLYEAVRQRKHAVQ